MEDILARTNVLRLAMVDGNEPYIVAMNFAYEAGCIYLHSAKEGRKIDIIRNNNRVAFFADIHTEPVGDKVPCNYGMHFSSIFGTGFAVMVENHEDKIKGLDLIMKKHTGKSGFTYSESALEKTVVIRLDVDQMTGKMA